MKATFTKDYRGKNEITIKSDDMKKGARVFHSVNSWCLQYHSNGRSVWFDSYQEIVDYLGAKGW